MSNKTVPVTRSIKAQVDAHLDRLLVSVRLEAINAAIGLGFEDSRNLLREVDDEIAWWDEEKGFDTSCTGAPYTPAWNRVRCLNAIEAILDPKFVRENPLGEANESIDRHMTNLRRFLPTAGPRPTLTPIKRAA